MAQKIIRSLGIQASRLEAERIVKERGRKLPSNVLLDDYFCDSDRCKQVGLVFPAWAKKAPVWAREVLAYPACGGTFEKGRDIVDFVTKWVLPASCVPEGAYTQKAVQLFVDPEGFEESKGRVVVLPKSITMVWNAMESNDNGVFDKKTRVPVICPPRLTFSDRAQVARGLDPDDYDDLETIMRNERENRRSLERISDAGVRPLVRELSYEDCDSVGRVVRADYWPGGRLEVAVEATRR